LGSFTPRPVSSLQARSPLCFPASFVIPPISPAISCSREFFGAHKIESFHYLFFRAVFSPTIDLLLPAPPSSPPLYTNGSFGKLSLPDLLPFFEMLFRSYPHFFSLISTYLLPLIFFPRPSHQSLPTSIPLHFTLRFCLFLTHTYPPLHHALLFSFLNNFTLSKD